MADRTYTATAYAKGARKLGHMERLSREEAVDAAFNRWPKAEWVSCGYGYLGGFHIIGTKRWEWAEGQLNKIAKAHGIESPDGFQHPDDQGQWKTPAWMTAPGSPWDLLEADIAKDIGKGVYEQALARYPAKPTVTETHEPIRPLRAPDSPQHFAGQTIFGNWRGYYGEPEWPSRCYWLLPTQDYDREF